MDGFVYEEKPSFNRVATMAGKAGEAGKRVFWKIGLEELEKDSLFGGAWLEKLDFYFWQKSHWVFHL